MKSNLIIKAKINESEPSISGYFRTSPTDRGVNASGELTSVNAHLNKLALYIRYVTVIYPIAVKRVGKYKPFEFFKKEKN